MTALAENRNTSQDGTQPTCGSVVLGIAATTHIFEGSLVARNAAGTAVPASALNTSVVVGVADAEYDNTLGLANALNVKAKCGVFWFVNGGTSITVANIGQQCYALDDQTVQLTSGPVATPGTLPVAGKIVRVDATLGVAVQVGDVAPGILYISSTVDHADADIALVAVVATRNLSGLLPVGACILAVETDTTQDWDDGAAGTFNFTLGDGTTATLYGTDVGNVDGGTTRVRYVGVGACRVKTSTRLVLTVNGSANLSTLTGGTTIVHAWFLLP